MPLQGCPLRPGKPARSASGAGRLQPRWRGQSRPRRGAHRPFDDGALTCRVTSRVQPPGWVHSREHTGVNSGERQGSDGFRTIATGKVWCSMSRCCHSSTFASVDWPCPCRIFKLERPAFGFRQAQGPHLYTDIRWTDFCALQCPEWIRLCPLANRIIIPSQFVTQGITEKPISLRKVVSGER